MKQAFKYILIGISIFCFISPNFAQKKHKQKNKKVALVSKNRKGNKKTKKNTTKLGQAANLNTLLATSSPESKTTKVDSIPEKVVTILSDFKPQLKNVAKIGFINASVQNDTTSIKLEYQVPSQNLSFQYRPISLVPRVFKIDSSIIYKNIATLKAGFGNYNHRYINLNLVKEDAYANTHSFSVNNESITGLHHLQNSNDIGFNYISDININEHNKIQTQVYYKQSERYRYGLVPDSVVFPLSNYKQNYYLSGINLGLTNDNTKAHFIHFSPKIKFEHFEGLSGAINNWVYFKSPMYVSFKNDIRLDLDISYSYNQFNPKTSNAKVNTELRFDPSVEFEKFNSVFKLGVSPTFEKEGYNLYPTIEFKKKLTDSDYLLVAGWHTHVLNNTYSSIVGMNPWITVPENIEMTTQEKKFVEIQINTGKHLDYGVTISLNDYKNLPLFNKVMGTDRSKYGLLYKAIFEKKASTIELDAQLRYQFSDKLLVTNNFKYLQFNSLEENAKPWGILPLEIDSKLNWVPNKKWNLEGSLKYWTGANIFNENSIATDMKNALVLNAGVTYKFTPKWNVWLKGENLLDKPYERWADYPSLGVQLMAGVVYSFRK